MKNLLIVSPYYPPGPTACAHRARLLAKYLPESGWKPVVLCVHENYLEENLDWELVKLTASDVEVIKTSAIPPAFPRVLGLGEITLRAWLPMREALVRLLRSRRFDAVLFTGSHFYSMLHAALVRNKFGVPVVLDFQDPWVSAEGAKHPLLSKAGLSHLLATHLEPLVVRNAAFITSVSEIQNEEMAQRYPWLDTARMAAIPIGGDPNDFAAVGNGDTSGCKVSATMNICYVGTLLPRAGPIVRALFDAVSSIRRTEPALAARLRFHFVGTSNQPSESAAQSASHKVMPIAESAGIADLVTESPVRVPFVEALRTLAQAHALLLIGSDEPHYTASKIYPALMSARPYLSIFHAQSSSHEILRHSGGGVALAFSDLRELRDIVPQIAMALKRLATDPTTFGIPDPRGYAPYTADAVAQRFGEILAGVVAANS